MKFDVARQPLVPAFLTLLVFISLAIYAAEVIVPVTNSSAIDQSQPLLQGLIDNFSISHHWWAKSIAAIMLLGSGLMIGQLTARYNLYSGNTCLPIALYGVFACVTITTSDFLSASIASFLLVLSVKNFCRMLGNNNAFDPTFRASFYLGLLVIVYPTALPLILILPLALILSHASWRKTVISSAGILLPIFTASYIYWAVGNDFLQSFLGLIGVMGDGEPVFSFDFFTQTPHSILVLLGTIVFLDLLAILFFYRNMYAAGTKSLLILNFNIGVVLFALLGILFARTTPAALGLVAVPSAILIPLFFVRIDRYVTLLVYLVTLVVSLCSILQYFIWPIE